VTASLARLSSVLAEPLPDTLWVEFLDGMHIAHEGFSAAITQCHTPLNGMSHRKGHNHHALIDLWCTDCFGTERCQRWVVDTYGRNRKRCGQPSGAGTECRWHHNLDVTLDRRIGEAA